MMLVLTILLFCFAVFLECATRAPAGDDWPHQ